jgi:hypothetical protein
LSCAIDVASIGATNPTFIHRLDLVFDQLRVDIAVFDFDFIFAQLQFGKRYASSGIGIVLKIMPKTRESSIPHLIEADRAPEMGADVAEGPDRPVASKYQNVVITDPARELPGGVEFRDVANSNKTGQGARPINLAR